MASFGTNRRQLKLEHLDHLRDLSQSLASAISAIEKNNLPDFETQLALQETICHRLTSVACAQLFPNLAVAKEKDKNKGREDGEPENGLEDAELFHEIRQAHIALAQSNRVYGALLMRARRSVALMAAVGRNHAPLPQCHTWSCEA